MFVVDILLAFLGFTLVVAMWLMLFMFFDNEVLNGYFKRKLQKRFPVEEVR
jgi:hypothetical protein